MHEYGLTSKQLASVALTQRRHAILNGNAQMRKPITYDDYETSRVVADPLRVLDCCLMTDGAAAFVMCSAERAADYKQPPVYMMGAGYHCVPISGNSIFVQNPDYLGAPGAPEATQKALSMAGISLQDIDFAEVYDCFSISFLLELEDIGFCGKGEAGAFVEEGHTAIGGSLPVNTHGGLMSHGYLLGMNHVVETVRQLRGQAGSAQVSDAEIGLFGGMGSPEYGTLILRKG
jgi:acetyl-CoA acetyltransferase